MASIVHEHVFASGNPPPQILLRDYARGVVERAIYLGADISINLALIRPPYRSNWPEIPSENDIVSLTPNRSKGAWAEGDLEWSRNRIHNSVMDSILNDFGRYVIGSESESNWLSLRLDEDPWQSPEQRTETLLAKLDQTERAGYEEFKRAETRTLSSLPFFRRVRTDGSDNEFTLEIEDDRQKERLQESRQLLMSALTEEHRLELESIEQAKLDGSPRFDVRVIQRYVLWRVFDLGWTIDRFGEFARFYIGDHGRAANKPERMGKKYQWIAFHEILAYISDHFQYRKRYFIEEGERQYEGPWQESRRDIDPSCTLRSTPGGTSWGPHISAWWGEELYEAWCDDISRSEWLANTQDMPDIGQLLEVVNPKDGSHWLNVNGSFVWKQPHPPDREPYDQEGRQLWVQFTGYFVRVEAVKSFMSWARTVDFWGRWMPEPLDIQEVCLGEYVWAPAFQHSLFEAIDTGGWVCPDARNGRKCPTAVQPASFRYFRESAGFDCSLDDNYELLLPQQDLIDQLNLQWSCRGADFLDGSGNLVAYDPTAHENGPTALLLDKVHVEKYLREKGLALCWVVLGEKLVVGGIDPRKYHGLLTISGAYRLTQDGPVGFLKPKLKLPDADTQGP